MTLAEKIVYLRRKRNWSQEQLAELLDISRQSVSKWESQAAMPDLDKIVKLSQIFGVSTDQLLRDDLSMEEEIQAITDKEVEDFVREDTEIGKVISEKDACIYMDKVKEVAPKIALGTLICIISPVCLLLLATLAEYGYLNITEDMAGGFGTAILLCMVACAVAIFIIHGMKLSKYEFLEKEPIILEQGVREIIEEKKVNYEGTFRKEIAVGVSLCILGVVPIFLAAGFDASDVVMIGCICLLLILIAAGVYRMVCSAMVWDSYSKLLQEEDYSVEKKRQNKKSAPFAGIYWCLITAIYLWISFTTFEWNRTWIIWPVAGVAFAAFLGIVNVFTKNK